MPTTNSVKPITVAQLKKLLAERSKDEIIDFILSLYKSSAAVKQAISAVLSEDYAMQLLEDAKKKLDKIFFPANIARTGFSLKEAKAVVSNFVKVCPNDRLVARLNFHFAKNAVDFTNDFGDIDEPFYNALANHFANAAEVIALYPDMREEFMPQLEKLADETRDIGWGVYDELSDILERIR